MARTAPSSARPPAPAPETDTGEATPDARCPHCGRPFTAAHARDLHLGERHDGALTDAEREAHEAARAAERDDLFYFHLRAVIALGVIYGITVLLYMIALGSDLL